MTNAKKKDNASLSLSEKKANPIKFKFFTYEIPKNEFLTKKRFKLRAKKDYTKYKTSNIAQGYWAKSEHKKFIEALYLYDCDWKKIQKYIKNRIDSQVRSHAQKFYLKLKYFKDEELGLDFTTSNVKSLSDIIKIIKEKESNSENCGKLLFIISEKLSFGKNTSKTHKKNEENKLNNCERQNESNSVDYSANYNYINNNFYQINFPELLMYININNQQFLNSLLNINLLTRISCTNFYNDIITKNNGH